MELDIASKVQVMLGGQALEICRLQALVDQLQARNDELEEQLNSPLAKIPVIHQPGVATLREVPREEVADLTAEALHES